MITFVNKYLSNNQLLFQNVKYNKTKLKFELIGRKKNCFQKKTA